MAVRERFAIGRLELPSVLDVLRARLSGAVVVSTCNRVEIYAEAEDPATAQTAVREFLTTRAGEAVPGYFLSGAACVRHLLRVAAGLDSMVLGETEILGQLKQAYAAAVERGAATSAIHRLFQHTFRAAKHVRTETRITRGPASVGAVAAEFAAQILGGLKDQRVMILGAGDTSERTARALVARGARMVIVSNRHFARATRLAGEIGGMALELSHWADVFSDVDILICSTSAPHVVVTREKIEPLLALRAGRPLVIIDLAVPRDVEPAVTGLPGVHLYDIDSLEETVRRTLRVRRADLAECERLLLAHAQAFASADAEVR